jgi:hypothetical protein
MGLRYDRVIKGRNGGILCYAEGSEEPKTVEEVKRRFE